MFILNKVRRMDLNHAVRLLFLFVVVLLMTGVFVSSELQAQGESDNIVTPFQAALGQSIRERQVAGLPAPEITTSVNVLQGRPARPGFDEDVSPQSNANVQTIIGTTVIAFSSPAEAGFDVWPDLVVADNMPAEMNAVVNEGDYTEQYRVFMENAIPDIWDTYTFGMEPRTYTYVETITSPTQSISALVADAFAEALASTSEDILIGFTYQGPDLPYFIEQSFDVLGVEAAYFKAGFDLSWAAGLRLPANVNITGPDVMELGDSYDFNSTMNTSNWSASQYSNTGVASEGGNEFVFRANFFAGVTARIAGVNVCPSCSVSFDVDESSSFETPLGAGASFPIPTIDIPVYELDLAVLYFKASFQLDPNIGSDELRASWRAVPGTDATGSGSLVYTTDGGLVTFGEVTACNLGPGNQAQVEIFDFEYSFNVFELALKASIELELFGFGGEVANPTLFTLDLSSITGGAYLPDHVQCNAIFQCSPVGPDNRIGLSVPVIDVDPPLTMILPSGTAGNNGWYISDVTVTLTADDQPTGCGNGVDYTEYSLDNVTWLPYTGAFVISDEGLTTVYYRSADVDGNLEETKSFEIRIDKTPPEITCYPTPDANAFGWYNVDVTIVWEATDAVSGIEFVSPSVVISTEGANQSRSGFARDVAGNEASCDVVGINIDKTPPDIVINQPEARTYDNTETFIVDWLVTDALSGVQSESGALDGNPANNGELINLLLYGAGPHTFTVEALDFADNPNNASVDFFVDVDIDGLIASVNFMCDLGLVRNHGICNSLLAKLNAAQAAINRGQNHTACNILNAFINQATAQRGHMIEDGAAGVMIVNANYVCNNLPSGEVVTEEPPVEEPPVENSNGNANGNGNSNGNGNGNANGNSNGNGNGNANGNSNGNGGDNNTTNSNEGNGNANGNSNGNGNGNANGNSNGSGNGGN